ncbi:hypothetical protein QTP70_008640 [Hemibagrus guttatus]|uniref:ribonuclease H n=1 Tax=Hemibagrus guttatus TaxID=175788 RepID=A0AAE0Q9X7_9TELE|nr:hypothetical protein QTP70_008640 [Hemibagrus guttatus]
MYERSRTVVRYAVGQTEEFKVEVGLHQGSALSPFLFAIVMDQLSEEVRQESPWTMMFANDIVICSESREQVEETLERWRFLLERRGMKDAASLPLAGGWTQSDLHLHLHPLPGLAPPRSSSAEEIAGHTSLPPCGLRPSRAEVITHLDYASGDVSRCCCSAVDVVRFCCSAVTSLGPPAQGVDVTRCFCSAVDVVRDPSGPYHQESWTVLSSVFSSNSSHLRDVNLSHNNLQGFKVQLLLAELKDLHCNLEILRYRRAHGFGFAGQRPLRRSLRRCLESARLLRFVATELSRFLSDVLDNLPVLAEASTQLSGPEPDLDTQPASDDEPDPAAEPDAEPEPDALNLTGTNFIPDRSRPGLTTTAIGAVDLQGAGGNWATVGRRSRGGRRVHRQREKRKGKSVGLRIGTMNVGTMTGKGRELADMMERRKVDILCVQETRWKGSKARSIGAGFKLFYYGVDSKRNGVGVVLKEKFVRNVLEVKRVSDRVMSLKLEIEGVMLNVVSGYAPQVGCELEEKERFWSELDEVMESIPTGERVVIGADFNGHVGEGNTGDEEVMGKFGVKERNLEGQMVVDFAKRMDMGVVNTYFQKREEHRVTYKCGGRSTQVDYILCRRGNLKEISDCKVVVGESVARQHRMVVCRMTLMVCKKKRSKIEIEKKTKWWKLKKEECCEEFRQKLRQALGGQVVLPDDWETTAEVIRETGRKVLGVSSGRRKEDKETW